MARFSDILFWILILAVIGIALWLAFGSPEFETSLITIIIFVAGSEILLWKTLFAIEKRSTVGFSSIDKRTAVGFERVKLDFGLLNNRIGNMEKDIKYIKENLIKKRK